MDLGIWVLRDLGIQEFKNLDYAILQFLKGHRRK
jgi:hypothetical protein